MSVDPEQLREHLNRAVRLRFSDGEVVEVTLLGVDSEEDKDLTYEVLRVVRHASPPARGTGVGATVVADLRDLEGYEPLA